MDIKTAIKKIIGSQHEREVRRLQPLVDEINELADELSGLTAEELRAKTDEFRQYIDERLEEPLSNARLAEIALSSESRFIRRFREATGRTPARYVQERRLERASELLVSTDYSIDRIAEASGFANRYYFTRVFTQRMGLPPGRYRSERPHIPSTRDD